jgi:hypothetical protein
MRRRGRRRGALSPIGVSTWLSEERLEPCRRIYGGAAWILLTFPCFRRGFESTRRHGRTRGAIITYYWSNLDGTPVLFLRSLRRLAKGRAMMDPQ